MLECARHCGAVGLKGYSPRLPGVGEEAGSSTKGVFASVTVWPCTLVEYSEGPGYGRPVFRAPTLEKSAGS